MPDPKKPIADLSGMTINEVAVCRQGMNPGAKVALFKSADPPPSTTSEAPMSTTPAKPPPFKPCADCADPAACTQVGKCASEKPPVAKTASLTIPGTVPVTDPFAKAAKDIMADLCKGTATPSPALVAAVMKAVGEAQTFGAAEVKKVQDAFAAADNRLAKADDDDAKTFGQILPAELAMQDWWRFNDALYASLRSILESSETDDAKLQMVMTSLEQFKNVMTRRMAAAIAASAAATDALLKGAPAGAPAPTSIPVIKEDPVSGNSTTVADAFAKATTIEAIVKALPEAAAKVVTDALAKAGPAEDPIAKALAESPILKAQFAAVQKKADEAEALAKSEQELRKTADRIAVAKADYGNLPTTPAAMAGVLKAMEGMDEAVVKTLTEVLKAGNEAIGKNVLGGEIGKSGGGASVAGAAETQVLAKAEELRKADSSLSEHQAIAKVYEANPDLYTRVQAEQRA